VTGRSSASTERGFTYLGLLLAVVVMGLALSAAGTLWSFTAQREREAQLLFAGDQYRIAIGRFYSAGPGAHRYPQELQELVEDTRVPEPKRYLRKLLADPMTGRMDWTLLRDPDGGIYGVASSATGVPLKRANFRGPDEKFNDAQCYCDWKFEYAPARAGLRPRQSDSPLSGR
jgi:type II secretory pathway pseudopilin PulG